MARREAFVRVHAYDTRRDAAPAVLTDPKSAVPNSALSAARQSGRPGTPRQGSRPPAPRGLPWTSGANDQYGLWVFRGAPPQALLPAVPANGLWSELRRLRPYAERRRDAGDAGQLERDRRGWYSHAKCVRRSVERHDAERSRPVRVHRRSARAGRIGRVDGDPSRARPR